MYTIPENLNYDDGDLVDTNIKDMSSKYTLVNTAPDFGKTDDPFASLGPIAVRILRNKRTDLILLTICGLLGIFGKASLVCA